MIAGERMARDRPPYRVVCPAPADRQARPPPARPPRGRGSLEGYNSAPEAPPTLDPTRMTRHLILVPTDIERRLAAPRLASLAAADVTVEVCGFGIAAAAARTSQLIAALRPQRVILVGIAGRLDDRLAIGTAALFAGVACHGIGAGSGPAFIPAGALGWPQWPGSPGDPDSAIGDLIPCAVPDRTDLPSERLLLTVTAAAAGPDDVRLRRTMFPEASAEEMEGFAVALACRLARVPCTILRGISNDAGDRDTARWRIREAVEAAADLTLRLVMEDR